jgi:hypothetical protein
MDAPGLPADDVPSPIDLRDMATARKWAEAAMQVRPRKMHVPASSNWFV